MTTYTVASTTQTSSSAAHLASPTPGIGLGKDDFLKMLIAQLRYQDPLNPIKDHDFLGQVAQFTSVEQLTNLTRAIEASNRNSLMSQAVGLIGKQVTYVNPDDPAGTLTGEVSAVRVIQGEVYLQVANREIPVHSIIEVTSS